MTQTYRIALSGPDRTGLVAAVAGRLFDLGADLADTSFATLGQAAEFAIVCDLPDGVTTAEVREALVSLPELAGAEIWVGPFRLPEEADPERPVTHRVIVSGGDRPGLLARLAEVFGEYGGLIVRLDSHRLREARGLRYAIRFEVNLPSAVEGSCLATIKNTAEDMGLSVAADRV